MLYELVDDSVEADPDAFLDAYLEGLQEVLELAGRDRAVEAGVDEQIIEALIGGHEDDLTVSDASKLLALDESFPDAETIRSEALDHLLLGMTTAVLDVETVAANLAIDVSPTGVQQRIEGRAEMSLAEYAHVHALLVERKE